MFQYKIHKEECNLNGICVDEDKQDTHTSTNQMFLQNRQCKVVLVLVEIISSCIYM